MALGLSRLDWTCADVSRWMISGGWACLGQFVLLRGSLIPLLAPMGSSEVMAQRTSLTRQEFYKPLVMLYPPTSHWVSQGAEPKVKEWSYIPSFEDELPSHMAQSKDSRKGEELGGSSCFWSTTKPGRRGRAFKFFCQEWDLCQSPKLGLVAL